MITGISHSGIFVLDQDSAKKFYSEVLGFEVRTDVTMDGFRWLTVGHPNQPGFELVLSYPGPPMLDPETAEQVRAMLAKGVMSGGVLATSDCKGTYEDLRAKGVTFVQEPAERPYGVEAVFRDDSGNWFSLTERRH